MQNPSMPISTNWKADSAIYVEVLWTQKSQTILKKKYEIEGPHHLISSLIKLYKSALVVLKIQRLIRSGLISNIFSSVTQSCPTLCDPLNHRGWSHLILCRPLLLLPSILPSIRVFPMSQLFASGGWSIGVSASPSVLPMNIQDWFPLGWTGWVSLLSKGLSKVFSNTIVQKHQFFGTQLSL